MSRDGSLLLGLVITFCSILAVTTSFALLCELAREGHFVGDFRRCSPHGYISNVGLSSEESSTLLAVIVPIVDWLVALHEGIAYIQMEKEVSRSDVEAADTFPLWLQVTVFFLPNHLQLLLCLYTKVPPCQVPPSIFQFFTDTRPKSHAARAHCDGSRLACPTGSSLAVLAAPCKGLQLSRCFLRARPEPSRMSIFSVSVPRMLWLLAEPVVLRTLSQISNVLWWMFENKSRQ